MTRLATSPQTARCTLRLFAVLVALAMSLAALPGTASAQCTPAAQALCKPATLFLNANGMATLTPADVDNGSNDGCGGSVMLAVAPFEFTCADLGSNTVTLTVFDNNGGFDTCTAVVTVMDSIAPTPVVAPFTASLDGTGNVTLTGAEFDAGSTDNCAISGFSVTPNSFTCADVGAPISVTVSVSDTSGNVSMATTTVTIEDNTAPVVTCPTVPLQTLPPGTCSISVSWSAPTATDNCGVMSVTTDIASGSNFSAGTTTVTATATDVNGNTSTCTFDVVVDDLESPVITCPTVTQTHVAGECGDRVTFALATATDNCPGVTVVQTAGPASGDLVAPGMATISFLATDTSGRTDSCSVTVTVTDTEDPVLGPCPADITVSNDSGACGAVVNFTLPTATDNCTMMPTVTSDMAPGSLFPIGTTPVTVTATDGAGNTDMCTFSVTVNDTEAPVLGTLPADITVSAASGACDAMVTFSLPTATDNCPGVVVSSSPASGSTFGLGVNTVTVTATDPSGNTDTGTFTVTVQDMEDPALTNCSSDILLDADAGACTATATWPTPVASDNCPGVSIAQTAGLASGSSFPVGTTFIQYTATDAGGRTSVCFWNVTVTDVEAPTITCPPDINTSTDAGACEATGVALGIPVTDDACGVATVTNDAPASFSPGTTTVTWTVTDVNGLSATCTQDVTVADNEVPVISCPADITMADTGGDCQETLMAAMIAVTATDNCDGAITPVVTGVPAGNVFPVGMTTISATATDAAGNSASCSFTVTIIDSDAPTVTGCPSDISVTNTPGSCDAVVSWTPPMFSDNCGLANSGQTMGPAPGSSFAAGTTTTIEYSATDVGGLTTVCSFTVTVTDTELPTISCPADITVATDPGACDAVVTYTAPVGADNCMGAVTSADPGNIGSGGTFGVGSHIETFTVTDAAGNTASCSFTITVEDMETPTITCPADITVSADPGACDATVNYTVPVGVDNCMGAVTSADPGNIGPGGTFAVGTHTETFTVTDGAGNSDSCSITITVNDTELPTISCPADMTVPTDPGACDATVNYTVPVGADNCMGAVTTADPGNIGPGGTFGVGTHTETFTVTDAAGNSASCSFTITVVDQELPVIAGCPGNITVSNDTGNCNAVVTWIEPTVTDNCMGATISGSHAPGDTFPVGTTTVTYTAVDAAGNAAVDCTFDVTVTDSEAPVINGCPTDITVGNDMDTCGAVVTWTAPTVSDNCMGSATLSGAVASGALSGPVASGDTFPVGVTTVTYTAADGAGNPAAPCTFTVTVNDTQDPELNPCPNNITQNVDPGMCSAVVTYSEPTVTDNCPLTAGQGSPATLITGLASGSAFPVGTTMVNWVGTDDAGNQSFCTFDVTIIDNELPSITCPADITVNADSGACDAVVTYSAPVGTDNCPSPVTTQTAGLGSGAPFPVGVTTETYEVVDASGNAVSCSFTVTVVDNQAPMLSGCPASPISVSNDPGVCGAVVSLPSITAMDNCDGAVTPTLTGIPAGGLFPIGTTTVIALATDNAGNSASCSFDVIVSDTEAPAVNCPGNISVGTDAGICGAVVSFPTPSASDNCPGVVVTLSHASGSTFPLGTTTVTATATDASNNMTTCSFTVDVNDDDAPILSGCPAGPVMADADAGLCTASSVSLPTITAADNCDGAVSVTLSPSGPYMVGTTSVTASATDTAGNTASCSFDVVVADTQDPTITCPADVTVSADSNCEATMVALGTPTTADNCGVADVSNDAPMTFPLGTTMVTWTVTDDNGLTATCMQSVTVEDTTGPVFTGPTAISQTADGGLCSAVVTFSITADDNCDGAVAVTQTDMTGLSSGDAFPVGVHTLTFEAMDTAVPPNVTPHTLVVTVTDNEDPVISDCPADIVVDLPSGVCDTVVTFATPTAISDNCMGVGAAVQTMGPASGSTFFAGVSTIEFTVTDAAGNTAICSFTVTVRGDFSDVTTYGTGPGTGPRELVLADLGSGPGMLEPDGFADIVTANEVDHTLTVLFNDGTGSFPTSMSVALGAGSPVAVVAGDFVVDPGGPNGPRRDLAVALKDSDTVVVLENDGAMLSVHTTHDLGLLGLAEPVALARGELNGGGMMDIAVACQGDLTLGGAGLAVILDNATSSALAAPGAGFRRPQDVAIGDLDGDLALDVAACETSTTSSASLTDNVLLYQGDGAGGFMIAADHLDTGVLNPTSLCVADMDADGNANDVAVVCAPDSVSNGSVVVFLNLNGVAAFGAALFNGGTTHGAGLLPTDIACADLQGDSLQPSLLCRQDVVTANFGSTGADDISLLLGYDCPTLSFVDGGTCNIGDGVIAVATADLNGDGLPDLVTANRPGDEVAVFLSAVRAISTPFGTGCPGTGGLIPAISGPALAIHDMTASVMLSNARPNAQCVLGVSSGIAVSPLGMGSSCINYLAPPVLVVVTSVTDMAGEFNFTFAIPPAPMFTNTELYFQWAVFDPNGNFMNILAFSDALRVRIGN